MIFSAHGVPKSVPAGGRRARGSSPSTRPARWSRRFTARPRSITGAGATSILVGHAGHPEVVGHDGPAAAGRDHAGRDARPMSQASSLPDAENLAYVTQTTLSVDDTREIVEALAARFPAIVGPHKEDICYATTNRQEAVKRVAPHGRRADRRRLAELLELAAPARGRRARRLPGRRGWCCAPTTSTGRLFGGIRRSASPPAPRRPRCWSRRSSTPSRSASTSRSSTVSTADESVFFPLPRELRGEAAE